MAEITQVTFLIFVKVTLLFFIAQSYKNIQKLRREHFVFDDDLHTSNRPGVAKLRPFNFFMSALFVAKHIIYSKYGSIKTINGFEKIWVTCSMKSFLLLPELYPKNYMF